MDAPEVGIAAKLLDDRRIGCDPAIAITAHRSTSATSKVPIDGGTAA
jgi:hypothetical protein